MLRFHWDDDTAYTKIAILAFSFRIPRSPKDFPLLVRYVRPSPLCCDLLRVNPSDHASEFHNAVLSSGINYGYTHIQHEGGLGRFTQNLERCPNGDGVYPFRYISNFPISRWSFYDKLAKSIRIMILVAALAPKTPYPINLLSGNKKAETERSIRNTQEALQL